jgi:hypothetical protein
MQDVLTYILLMFVLSFVATCLLVGFHWSFRRRKIQEYQPTDDDEVVSTEEVYQREPFRWYYVFIVVLGVLLALWLLPVLAGMLLAMFIIVGAFQYIHLRRALDRYLRTRGTQLPQVFSFVLAPCVALSRLYRYVRKRRYKAA